MSWLDTSVIITKLERPFKGYVSVVKDVLPGQDTAGGLKIAIQLLVVHLDPSAGERWLIIMTTLSNKGISMIFVISSILNIYILRTG